MGAEGEADANGDEEEQGVNGDKGEQGANGDKGDQGTAGAEGQLGGKGTEKPSEEPAAGDDKEVSAEETKWEEPSGAIAVSVQ